MSSHLDHIKKSLIKRATEDGFRDLKTNDRLIDFCSNDYLGFSSEKEIHVIAEDLPKFGATGSRLISGNYQMVERLEQDIAKYHRAAAGLIFNTGYTANLGLFSCLPQRGDTIIYDELIHASIRDGIKLSNAHSFSFRHSDVDDLSKKLNRAKGNKWVVVEAIYSMDGDEAPLVKILTTCKANNAEVIVDEAHAVGVIGQKGEGVVADLGLEKEIFARVVTFGKALGCHGAIVLGSNLLRNYLINFSRPFIYTTALPLTTIIAIKKAYQFLENNIQRKERLTALINYFQSVVANYQLALTPSNSAIQSLLIVGNNNAKKIANAMRKEGFDVRAILSPTVQKGKERLRICIHSFNTEKQLDELVANLILQKEITSSFGNSSNSKFTHLFPSLREENHLAIDHLNNYYNKNLKLLARENRKEMTKAELKIWNDLLKKRQCMGYRFLRQRPILNYIVDFMCQELNLVIEIDGYSHHFDEVYSNDLKKQTQIEKVGFTVIRFQDNEVMNDFKNVIRTIEIYIESYVNQVLPSRGDIEG